MLQRRVAHQFREASRPQLFQRGLRLRGPVRPRRRVRRVELVDAGPALQHDSVVHDVLERRVHLLPWHVQDRRHVVLGEGDLTVGPLTGDQQQDEPQGRSPRNMCPQASMALLSSSPPVAATVRARRADPMIPLFLCSGGSWADSERYWTLSSRSRR